MTEPVSSTYGVHSEVGRLRKVLVCAPGLAHRRLTPSNNHDLLFDDVMWVENAQRDHADFVNKLTQRGVEVVELHALLAETLQVPGARDWLLDRKIEVNHVGLGLLDGTRAFLESLAPRDLAEFLIGGLATNDGTIEALFVLKKGGEIRYNKSKQATASWESSFIGAVAIPRAQQQYPLIVQKLLAAVLADPDFQAALK
jgi:hypothetical protein